MPQSKTLMTKSTSTYFSFNLGNDKNDLAADDLRVLFGLYTKILIIIKSCELNLINSI